ncbi:D-hexose-6-phosphate mutarotase [Curvibacter sp. HBC28]|uniref:Putative glucose-6-phosphate 1-epimerase n=1 Tax=Curvibacter microcysteis TaxID=3026419 RepID=A0ABT5MFC9_9BURK|nr:D-hexose-6-phosphate mutarotase [Curvibacter sp. HBC28]MDD0815095.1 D-hexose-6-phosphate mutarotase [Curvibacter sp. HBC28]
MATSTACATWRHQALGAQLLTAQLGGERPLLYLSPLSACQPLQPARGGVPVLFPQFAQWGPGRKHGFARQLDWQWVGPDEPEADRLSYGLDVLPGQWDGWPHAAQLRLDTRRWADSLDWSLQVRNTGQSAFDWSGGLHPYWAVEDVWATELDGLQSCPGRDQLSGLALSPQAAPWRWGQEGMECLFDGLPDLTLRCATHELQLSGSGFTQWMVWNPGAALAAGLTDLPPGDERRFICVEPVCASRPQHLAPGQTFTGTLSVRWQARS